MFFGKDFPYASIDIHYWAGCPQVTNDQTAVQGTAFGGGITLQVENAGQANVEWNKKSKATSLFL